MRFYPSLAFDTKRFESKRTQIYRWRQEREKLEKASAQHKGDKKKLREVGTGTILTGELEGEIVLWISDLRGEGVPVSSRMLKMKALEVAKEAGVQQFSASPFWIEGFKGRHRMSIRAATRQGQTSPDNLDEISAAFAIEVQDTMRQLGITRGYNADQTAVFFEYIPKRTINAKGGKTVWVKCGSASKNRATAMLLGDSTGACYTPFVIFKAVPSKIPAMAAENRETRCGFGKHVWREIKHLMEEIDVNIHGNTKGWWISRLSLKFLEFHFGDRSSNEPILLLWDDFSGHWTAEVQSYAKSINVVLMKVPPHATSVCQPADVAWNFPFKARLRQQWLDDLQLQIASYQPGDVPFRLAPPDRATISRWITRSWSS